MKFFIDTADTAEIREAIGFGLVDGATTNPSLVAKTGRPFREVVAEICALVPGPVSLEAVSLETDGIVREGRELAKIGPNVVVKVPMTLPGLAAVRRLQADGVPTNVTLVFSAAQALLAAKAGAAYVSPFVGRLDDVSEDGMELVGRIVDIYHKYGFATEVIVASIRHPMHVVQSALLGAQVATIPFGVIRQLARHPLTDAGIERFLTDWRKVPGNAI